jgi:hypothetical protein
MPDTTSTKIQIPPPLWTGRLDFDLLNGRGWRVATIDVVVRIDNLTLWHDNRSLAVIDRDRFRQWLVRPKQPLAIDDVVWTVQENTTCITIDNRITYPVPRATVGQLLGVL